MRKKLWRGSTLQSITVIVLPLTLLLVIVSFGSFQIHQNAMRSLVGDRDERSVRTAASTLASQIDHELYAIRVLAALANANPQTSPEGVLTTAGTLMESFDYGTAFYDSHGILIGAGNQEGFWQSLEGTAELSAVLHPMTESSVSAAFTNTLDGKQVILVASPIPGSNRVAVGAFAPGRLIQGALQGIFPAGGQTSIYVIDPSFQILYHSGPATLESSPDEHPGVGEAFKGQSGTTFVKAGNDEHVVAYSPVLPVGWAIVTEESWEAVSSPILRTSQMIPLVLVPALLLAILALWFGARQIVRPLQALESRAAKLAWGDFKQIKEPVGGIAEIRDLQNELAHMADRLQSAEASLHSYIGAITQGQEAERLRLARELHDDTIQSLIALKQRVQLASLSGKRSGASPELKELEALIEGTIDNLRRTTRALRPIYLEDLGLVTALEMLTGEIGQSSGLQVNLQATENERRLGADVELALYRMVQEALNNTVQHSQAKHASIALDFSTDKLTLDVSDDGKGFEVPRTPAEYTPQGHFGLLGLYERSELIGARLEIKSSPKNGTHLRISMPYANNSDEGDRRKLV